MERGFNRRTIKLYYHRFKDSPWYSMTVFSSIILVCLLLFVFVILPQLGRWFSIQEEIAKTKTRIAAIKGNISFLSGMNETSLNRDVSITAGAIPYEIDYAGVLQAISSSAVVSGVTLSDFSFQVGQLTSVKKTKSGFNPLKLTIFVSGSIDNVKRFITEINKKLPLSEVTEWQGSSDKSTIVIMFIHKQPPQIILQDTVSLKPLTASNRNLINTLSTWRAAVPEAIENTSTDSASGAFPF
ncbi:MAG: hypothetical protein HY431_00225 [Candidatus Levybacteria bacterium]|nr:hypothetical protein [Candidatus Levybacteria bacterium]